MEKSIIHLEKDWQDTIRTHLPNTDICNKLAGFYSLFSDATRLKIIITLLLKEMCVNDLSTILDINQTTISHQLKTLKNLGAVNSYRKNKFIFYSVNNEFINNIMINGVDFIIKKAQ